MTEAERQQFTAVGNQLRDLVAERDRRYFAATTTEQKRQVLIDYEVTTKALREELERLKASRAVELNSSHPLSITAYMAALLSIAVLLFTFIALASK
jgi:hypothetical protein